MNRDKFLKEFADALFTLDLTDDQLGEVLKVAVRCWRTTEEAED